MIPKDDFLDIVIVLVFKYAFEKIKNLRPKIERFEGCFLFISANKFEKIWHKMHLKIERKRTKSSEIFLGCKAGKST